MQIGVERLGHAVATLVELGDLALDHLLDRGARCAEALDVGVEGTRDDAASGIETPGELRGPTLEHGGCRIDEVRHLGADPRLALVYHAAERLAAFGEG